MASILTCVLKQCTLSWLQVSLDIWHCCPCHVHHICHISSSSSLLSSSSFSSPSLSSSNCQYYSKHSHTTTTQDSSSNFMKRRANAQTINIHHIYKTSFSRLHYNINHRKSFCHFMPLFNRVVAQILSFSLQCISYISYTKSKCLTIHICHTCGTSLQSSSSHSQAIQKF